MRELTDLTIKDLLSSNTSTNTLIINRNFAEVKASILLLQSTFGIQIQNNTIGTPTTKFFVGQVSADKMYLPNIGDPNNVIAAKITFNGSDGSIKASALSTTKDIFSGNDVFVGESGKGGRVRLYPDRNTDTSKPPRLGDFRFIGSKFQGYIIEDEIPSTFSFSILGGAPSSEITIQIYDSSFVDVGTTTWSSNAITTSINLVNAILESGNPYVTASYSSGVITISSLPGLAVSLNGAAINIDATMTTDVTSGNMSGGVDGTKRWINFGEGGSVGATGAAGSSGTSFYGVTSGSSGANGSSGVNGSSGSAGTSGSRGSSGSSGTAGTSGSSGVDGDIGPAGFPGADGTSGSSGVNATAGTSGSSGTTPVLTVTSFDVPLGDASTTGFAWSSGYFTSWNDSYTVGQSLEDLDRVIKLLAPTSPPGLGTLSPLVLDLYYAHPISYYPTYVSSSGLGINLGSSGAAISNTIITDNTLSSVQLSNMSTSAWTAGGGFAKEPVRDVYAYRDSTTLGTIGVYSDQSITPGVTVDADLEITEYDYWNGIPGRTGFWPALLAKIHNFMNSASYGAHDATLSWEVGGSSLTTTFWYDNPSTPSFVSKGLSTNATGGSARWISGVPSLVSGDTITTTASIGNAVSNFYVTKPLVVASTTEVLQSSFGVTVTGAQSPGTLSGLTATGTVRNNIYTEDIMMGATGYNAKGTSVSTTVKITNTFSGRTMRADTVSDETLRYLSGGTAALSPTTYGEAYDTTISLVSATSYQYELQMINGYYQRLSGLNYSSNYPATGPNYSTEVNLLDRWVLFRFGPMNGISGGVITINNPLGTWAMDPISYQTSGIKIEGKVDDPNSPGPTTSSWIDCNTAWLTGTNPGASTSGMAAMVAGSPTTEYVKNFTFGTVTHSGYFWVRIGLPYGTDKKFKSVSVVLR